jgi:outer membrane lipoprotein-sorting protein
MKRIMTISIIGMMFLSLLCVQSAAQTADEILAKMIEAQGGRKALEGIKDTTFSGTMLMVPLNATGSLTMYQKEPNKMRFNGEIMGMTFIQAYDGTTAWGTDPQTGSAQEMPEKAGQEFKRQAQGQDTILNPKKLGITYTFKGKEKINDTDYLVLEQTFSDGHNASLYIDPATYLVYKTKSMTLNQLEAEVETESIQGDYKKVEGIVMPHSITIYQGGQEYMKITIQEITFNSDLEDSLFKMQ